MVEEAAQEVFLKAYTQLASYQGRGSFEGWLSRIAVNTCLNMVRTARRRPESPVSDLSDDEAEWLEQKLARASDQRRASLEDHLVKADLAEKVLDRMTPDDRLVLVLVDGNGFSVKETAELTGWSESKVKVQAMRARRRMRLAVEKLLGPKEGAGKDARRTHNRSA